MVKVEFHQRIPLAVSCTDLAHLLCLTPARVAQLIIAGILPKAKGRAQYDLHGSVRAYITYLRANQTDLHAQRTRWVRAKADKSELELRVRQGELTEVAKVQRQAFQAGRLVRDGMLAISDRLAGVLASPDHPQAKVHELMTKEIRQALETLSAWEEVDTDTKGTQEA